jgi:hypothetical protein
MRDKGPLLVLLRTRCPQETLQALSAYPKRGQDRMALSMVETAVKALAGRDLDCGEPKRRAHGDRRRPSPPTSGGFFRRRLRAATNF